MDDLTQQMYVLDKIPEPLQPNGLGQDGDIPSSSLYLGPNYPIILYSFVLRG